MKTKNKKKHNFIKINNELIFYQIDSNYVVAEDGCIFQIIPKNKLLDKNNEFIGDFYIPLIYQPEKDIDILYKYAGNYKIKEFIRKHYLFENLNDELLKRYDKYCTNDSVLNIVKTINEHCKVNEFLKEFVNILIDEQIKLYNFLSIFYLKRYKKYNRGKKVGKIKEK